VEEGESILDGAKRELLEESGYEAREFILWESQQPLSKIEWSVYIFIAKGLTIKKDNLDAGEKIEHLPVTFDELIEIGIQDNFYEKEVAIQFMQAKYDPQKKAQLQELFKSL